MSGLSTAKIDKKVIKKKCKVIIAAILIITIWSNSAHSSCQKIANKAFFSCSYNYFYIHKYNIRNALETYISPQEQTIPSTLRLNYNPIYMPSMSTRLALGVHVTESIDFEIETTFSTKFKLDIEQAQESLFTASPASNDFRYSFLAVDKGFVNKGISHGAIFINIGQRYRKNQISSRASLGLGNGKHYMYSRPSTSVTFNHLGVQFKYLVNLDISTTFSPYLGYSISYFCPTLSKNEIIAAYVNKNYTGPETERLTSSYSLHTFLVGASLSI